MRSRTALFATTVLSAALIVTSPRLSLSTGSMTLGHAKLANDCLACHTPFRGLPTAKCIACHPLDSIAIAGRGKLPPTGTDTALAGLHGSFTQTDCLECHSDHAGPDPANATVAFSHEALSPDFRQQCTVCHDGNRPEDQLHRDLGDNCAACHTTDEWKPATFEHRKFATSRACNHCHEQIRPADDVHRQGGSDCSPCHTTDEWKPASINHRKFAASRTCLECHQQVRPADDVHRQKADECKDCHTTTEWKPATFEHRSVAASRTCTDCHRLVRPADELHRQAGADCAACHTTSDWRPASIEHLKLTRQACTACHDHERPVDELHRQVGNDCGACHTTDAWKPATFEHDQYFVLDRDHNASCRTCHTDTGNYRSYTCYGCHEHSQANIMAEHRGERIGDIRDCVRCHRSADEHEGGREGGQEGRREHEDEDDD